MTISIQIESLKNLQVTLCKKPTKPLSLQEHKCKSTDFVSGCALSFLERTPDTN